MKSLAHAYCFKACRISLVKVFGFFCFLFFFLLNTFKGFVVLNIQKRALMLFTILKRVLVFLTVAV